jgi:arylsulfatase A
MKISRNSRIHPFLRLASLASVAWLALGSSLSAVAANAAPARKPNFVVINIDDLGYADIGAFGSKLNRTPNIDRMAKEGCKLTCFYAAPVCSPSRSALMTGCYPKRVLPIPGVLFPAGAVGLNPEERTVAELLKESGYATACIGKWHLGDQPEFLPTRQGFDYYLGIPYSNDMGTAEEGSKSSLGDPIPVKKAAPAKGAAPKDVDRDETGLKGASQPPLPLLENETVIARVKQEEQQGIVERYTKAAVKFIREKKDQPFFLYLPHNAVHFPLYPGKAFQKKSANGLYGDWVEEVDWSVGQVLDTLRELKLDDSTLVVFTSDNGGTPRAVNTPLRGFKGSTWEGGMREPTIAWWPGKIPAGTTSDEVTGMMDILPTFVTLAGGVIPKDRKLDGADIWPLLSGEAGAKPPHAVFFYFRGLNLEAVRSGSWKLHLAVPAKKGAAAPSGPQLFDLAKDIGETNDLAAANPEIVKQLQALAATMDGDLGTKEIGVGCRPLGRVANPQPLMDQNGKVRDGFAPR